MHEPSFPPGNPQERVADIEEEPGKAEAAPTAVVRVASSGQDLAYAQAYWDAIPPDKRRPYEEAFATMLEDIDQIGSVSQFVSFAGSPGEEEKDRQKLSARRVFLNQHGYWVGKFKIDLHAGTAQAPVLNANALKRLSERCLSRFEGKHPTALFDVKLDDDDVRDIGRLVALVRAPLSHAATVQPDDPNAEAWRKIVDSVEHDLRRYVSGNARGTSAQWLGENVRKLFWFLTQ
jgi:hypothetical protein